MGDIESLKFALKAIVKSKGHFENIVDVDLATQVERHIKELETMSASVKSLLRISK